MVEQKHPFIITNNGNAVVKDLYPNSWATYFSEVFINILIRPLLLINQFKCSTTYFILLLSHNNYQNTVGMN